MVAEAAAAPHARLLDDSGANSKCDDDAGDTTSEAKDDDDADNLLISAPTLPPVPEGYQEPLATKDLPALH